MIRLGGFVITYHRTEILVNTINKLLAQTYPPEVLWIIDNSEDFATEHAIVGLIDARIRYHRMGYNAGPAGAAKIGLELCAAAGMDWIYWGDDNDPPHHLDTFEKLLLVQKDHPYCGILGAVGHFFDHKKGEIKRVQSRLLEKKHSLEVDCIAGNMNLLVSSAVIKAGVRPDSSFFFGFEELDFCLKAKRVGFTLIVHCGLFLDLRRKHNRIDFERPLYRKKVNPVREYYSLRNLLYIADSLNLNTMRKQLIKKWLAKSLYGFRYGPRYGLTNARMILLAFLHYYKGVKGRTLDL